MFLGGLWGFVESAVVVYWSMQIARILEDKMFAAYSKKRESNGNAWKALILGVSVVMLVGTVVVNGWLYFWTRGWGLLGLNGVLLAVLWGKAVLADGGSLFEFSAVCLYIAMTLLSGVLEESVKPSVLWKVFVNAKEGANIEDIGSTANDYSVILNAVGGLLTVLSLGSLPRVLGAVFDGTEQDDSLLVRGTDNQTGDNKSKEYSLQTSENREAQQQGGNMVMNAIAGDAVWWKGPLNAFSVIILTFKFLVWKGQVEAGEYYALGCRLLHAVAAVLFYFTFRGMEEDEEVSAVHVHQD